MEDAVARFPFFDDWLIQRRYNFEWIRPFNGDVVKFDSMVGSTPSCPIARYTPVFPARSRLRASSSALNESQYWRSRACSCFCSRSRAASS